MTYHLKKEQPQPHQNWQSVDLKSLRAIWTFESGFKAMLAMTDTDIFCKKK